MFKVPARDIYCDTFAAWLKETVWCFVVIKIWRDAIELRRPTPNAADGKTACPYCNADMPNYAELSIAK